MKKLIYIAIVCLVFSSCKKIETIDESKPILVKVEAIHTTGQVVTSEIVFVK
jgi:hypothetical protein